MKLYGIISSPNSGPCYHRVFMPLKLSEHEVYFSNLLDEEKLQGVDVVVVNRMFPLNEVDQVKEWKAKHGFLLVVDLDDFWQLDPTHILFDQWMQNNVSQRILDTIDIADVVTVSTPYLASMFNRDVHVLPNAIPKRGQFTIQKEPYFKPRVFYQGTTTHAKDIEMLRGPMKRINSEGESQTVVCGYHPDRPEAVRIASAVTSGMQYNCRVVESTTPDKYYLAYRFCDIALVPLIDSTFNRCKSNLKVLEAANVAAPCVVSNVPTYSDLPVNYVNQQSDWYIHLKKLINEPNYRQDKGEELKAYCDQVYNFERINNTRMQLYEYAMAER